MCSVSTPPGYDYYEPEGSGTHEGGEDQDADEEDQGDGEEEEEPWLDTPERLRLILGLVAEFTEGSVSKVESEVSALRAQTVACTKLMR
jgi:hypothetical protein